MYNPYVPAENGNPKELKHPRPQHTATMDQYQAQYSQSQYAQYGQPQYGQAKAQFAAQPQAPAQSQYAPQYAHSTQVNQGQGAQQRAPFQNQYQQNEYPQNTPNQYAQQQGSGAPYGEFFSDPAASMAAQFAKSSFGQSNTYLQQNFGSYMAKAGELKHYFKVTNSYVLRKLALILFPYRHKDWTRVRSDTGVGSAPACEDVNAPDLYIPLMSFVTYILLSALFTGLKGDFHPEVFGYLASLTLSCSFVDILIFKVGLYLLNCSAQISLWDLVSFSGYKYVSIIVLLCCRQVVGHSWFLFHGLLLLVLANLSLFLMRSLKALVLPIGMGETISDGQRRLRVQFLFIYSVAVQFVLLVFMSR